jgi:hypothetical protein
MWELFCPIGQKSDQPSQWNGAVGNAQSFGRLSEKKDQKLTSVSMRLLVSIYLLMWGGGGLDAYRSP